jgi:hypothetical protein
LKSVYKIHDKNSANTMRRDKNIGNPTAMNCSKPWDWPLDKDQHRRRRNAYNWYKLLAQPTRATMCRILDYTKGADFTRKDVDLLPWNVDESEVIEEAMKSLRKEKKEVSGKPGKSSLKSCLKSSPKSGLKTSLLRDSEDTVKTRDNKHHFSRQDVGLLPFLEESEVIDEAMKSLKKEKTEKQKKKKKKDTFLKEELGNSLTSLETTSLNSSSGYLDASLTSLEASLNSSSGYSMDTSATSLETSLNSSSGFSDSSFNTLDQTLFERNKGGFEDEFKREVLDTIEAQEENHRKKEERQRKREQVEEEHKRKREARRQKRVEAKKTSTAKEFPEWKIEEDSKEVRRERAFQWYARLATPCRNDFKLRVADMASVDITEDDVDSLPWNLTGSRVNIAKMNYIARVSIMKQSER